MLFCPDYGNRTAILMDSGTSTREKSNTYSFSWKKRMKCCTRVKGKNSESIITTRACGVFMPSASLEFWELHVPNATGLRVTFSLVLQYSETFLWETTAMRDHLSWRTTSFWQKVLHFNVNEPFTNEHLSWETIFLWPMGRYVKTGSTVLPV